MDWIQTKKDKYPNGNFIWVECIAQIRNNATGEIREYETQEMLEEGDEHPSTFNWEENNFSCDCNRLLFFKRAKGEVADGDWDVECTDGKFSVNLMNKKDRKVYYREYDVEQEPIDDLLKQFDEETAMMSITHYAFKLPIAKKLMDRRQEAIPAVLEYLRDGKGGMAEMTLLSAMLPDANPYQPEDVGAGFVGYKVQEAVDAWVKWGIANKWIIP